MRNKNLVVGVLIGAVAGLVFGYILGLAVLPPAEEIKGLNEIKGLLESKVVNSVNVFVSGKVTAISGENLTLEDKGGVLIIAVGEAAKIFQAPAVSAKPGENEVSAPTEIKFEELKIGETINAVLSISPEGKLETTSIFVVPEAPQAPKE